jgi:hypothetical protein
MTLSIDIRAARHFAFSALAGAALLYAAPLAAQSLPDARAVLARYVEAIGAAKLPSQPGLHVLGTFEIAAQGLRGTTELWHDIASGRSMQVLTLPGLGEIKAGFDTSYAWSTSPFEGPKILEQKEYVEQQEKTDVRTMRRDPAVVLEATVTERVLVDSQPCLAVKLKWKSGRETTECYSEATGLLVRTEYVETTAAGSMPMMALFSEYKTFGVLTIPTRTVKRAAGVEITEVTTDVKFEAIDPVKITPPAEILALRKK